MKEHKIQKQLLDRIIKDIYVAMKEEGKSIDGESIRGSQRYMIGILKCWKEIIKDNL